jgi:hypothetical protein
MAPFIGAMRSSPIPSQFVVVEIGAFNPQRADVETLCRESGVVPVSSKGS